MVWAIWIEGCVPCTADSDVTTLLDGPQRRDSGRFRQAGTVRRGEGEER